MASDIFGTSKEWREANAEATREKWEEEESKKSQYKPGTYVVGGWGGPKSPGYLYLHYGQRKYFENPTAAREVCDLLGIKFFWHDPLQHYSGVSVRD
jgi:hypothetical protein